MGDFPRQNAFLHCQTEYEQFAEINRSAFRPFCADGRHAKLAEKHVRTKPIIKYGILSHPPFEVAHLIPFSIECSTAWKPLFFSIVRSFRASQNVEKLVDFFFMAALKAGTDETKTQELYTIDSTSWL